MTTEIAAIEKQEVDDFRNEGNKLITAAKDLARSINDTQSLTLAATMTVEVKRRIKAIKERFKKAKADAAAAHKSICDLEWGLIEPYERVEEEILKPAIAAYNALQERKRREQEEAIRAEQRRIAEDQRLREAAQMEKEGNHSEAKEHFDAPIEVAPVIIPKAADPQGVSYRDSWQYRIVDAALIPREYLIPDEKKIAAIVRAMKSEARIAGIEIYNKPIVAVRI